MSWLERIDDWISASFSWLMKLVLLLVFFSELFWGDYLVATGALIALTISLLPSAIERNYHINLPWAIDFMVTLGLTLHTIGLYYNLYHDPAWWWWDNFTHFLGTAVIALLAFYIVFTLDYTKKVRLTLPFMVISTIMTAMAIGAFWEIGEFNFDGLFGTKAIIDLTDTIQDLEFDFLGSIVVAIIGVLYTRHLRTKHGPR
ncbi:MAG: hypothetical protein AAB817_00340 [Patescibacteria group bacterium]